MALQPLKGPKLWRADQELGASTLEHARYRYGIHPFELCRIARLGPRAYERWVRTAPQDPRHPFPIAREISRALAWWLTTHAIDQIEHNLPFVTLEQRARLLKLLEVEEPSHG